MNKTLFLLYALPSWLIAQPSSPKDSLIALVAQSRATNNRLAEAEALYGLGNYHYEKQEDQTALNYITAGLQQVPEGNPKLKSKLLYRKAMLLHFMGQDMAQCLPLLDSAYILMLPDRDPNVLGPFLQSYGTFLTQNAQFQKGQKILLEAEQIYLQNKELGNPDRMLNLYSNLVSAAYSLGDYQNSLLFARKGIEIGNKSNNFELTADLYYNNALTFAALGYEEDAEHNYLKSLELNQKGKVSSGIVRAKTALGEYYNRKNQAKLGLRYLAEAKLEAARTKDFYAVALVENMEAVHFLQLGNYSAALASVDHCIQYFETSKDPRIVQGIYYQKAKILKASGQLEEAIIWANKELEMAKQSNSLPYMQSCYMLLAKIEKELGDFGQALAYMEQQMVVTDSIYNGDLKSKLAEERTKQNIEAEQEARQKAELESKLLASQNQLFGTAAAGLLLILLIGGYLFWQLQKTRKQLENQNLQLTQLNATKDKFFGIIAHDLRNPLAAFQGVGEQLDYYLKKGDTDKLHKISALIAKSANNLGSLLDNLLSWALLNRGMIPYHPEPISLAAESALNLEFHENAAATKNINLVNNIKSEIKVLADRNALQTILRNLLGNAIKFTPKGGEVVLDYAQSEDKVVVMVKDSGTGIEPDKVKQLFSLEKRSEHGTDGEKGAGLGLLLCKELVEVNQGTLRVASLPGIGSTFEFSIPMA